MHLAHNTNKQNTEEELQQTTCEVSYSHWQYPLTMNQQPKSCFCKKLMILANCDLLVNLGISTRNAMALLCYYLQNMFLPIILQP